MRSCILASLCFSLMVCFVNSAQTQIIYKPISFSQDRIENTISYLKERFNIVQDNPVIIPKIITLHWTEIGTFQETWDLFNNETCQNPKLCKYGIVNVSAQFIVDRNGTIYQIMPDNWMARHVIGLDYYSIGVENVGGVGQIEDLTQEQVDANEFIIRHLVDKYPDITILEGHLEYTQMVNTEYWLEKDPEYRTQKVDPGQIFMRQIRERVQDLNLKSPYDIQGMEIIIA